MNFTIQYSLNYSVIGLIYDDENLDTVLKLFEIFTRFLDRGDSFSPEDVVFRKQRSPTSNK
jgi:hypothetical protein